MRYVRSRVTDDKENAAVRLSELATVKNAAAVVLETDGSFSVIEANEVSVRFDIA